ncbi:MAG: ankyrin repeat domain-containing protein [Planctomycetota bacterium]|nr:ankyrin repeat domain-containing protein [Planctomycetota bacterium]MDA1138535.1 ankyrin repeat domain-containing protein [Planctomycetota bacterium]
MEEKPRLAPELVEEFVRNSHGSFERVKELIEQEPTLVNATWDWGRGDWETGLGAASHVGRREIALFLLDHGARLDIFAATMLGKLEIVKATLEAFPEALHTPGPHGIPLIVHAQMGGEEAREVLEFMQSLSQA